MMASIGLLMALSLIGGHPALIESGGDPAPGLLVNRTVGTRPFDRPDPDRPTIVFIHGINPLPGVVHFTMAGHLSKAIARRYGPGTFNVLDWDWNAATFTSLRHRDNIDAAIDQGRRLAEALLLAGFDPAQVHLIGHSAGGLAAASAAQTIFRTRGIRVAQVTLLEPAGCTHDAIFEELQAVTSAGRVENYWTPGLSAFGRAADVPGVTDYRVDHPTPFTGTMIPSRSGHLCIVRWYIATAEAPASHSGFNTSVLLVREVVSGKTNHPQTPSPYTPSTRARTRSRPRRTTSSGSASQSEGLKSSRESGPR